MKSKTINGLTTTAACLLALTLYGCSSSRLSLVDQRDLVIQKQNSDKIRILWSDIYRKNGATWVYGVVKQQHPGSASLRTHVDLCITNPDGNIAYKTVTGQLQVPRDRLGQGPDWRRFRIRLPEPPAEGARVTMKVHTGPHEVAPAS